MPRSLGRSRPEHGRRTKWVSMQVSGITIVAEPNRGSLFAFTQVRNACPRSNREFVRARRSRRRRLCECRASHRSCDRLARRVVDARRAGEARRSLRRRVEARPSTRPQRTGRDRRDERTSQPYVTGQSGNRHVDCDRQFRHARFGVAVRERTRVGASELPETDTRSRSDVRDVRRSSLRTRTNDQGNVTCA